MIPSQEDQPVTHSTPTDIARERIINSLTVSPVLHQDFGLCPLFNTRCKNSMIRKLKSTCSIKERYCQTSKHLLVLKTS